MKARENTTVGPFVPTQWNTAADKVKFAKHFMRFVDTGFKETMFPKWFYQRLSNCFSHIAHYNQSGFYATWFADKRKQKAFLINAVNHPGYGDPAFTYSDVEKCLRAWIRNSGHIERLTSEIATADESRERQLLAALQAKYPEAKQ